MVTQHNIDAARGNPEAVFTATCFREQVRAPGRMNSVLSKVEFPRDLADGCAEPRGGPK
jgi:hypothetical protein